VRLQAELAFRRVMHRYKDYYTMLISKKAQFSNSSLVLKSDFNLNEDQLRKVCLLPHIVCSKAYVKAFQYKVFNFILYTNTKLNNIRYITDDKCSFCKSEPEIPSRLFLTAYTQSSSRNILNFYFYSLAKEFVHLKLRDALIGIITSECPLLN